jgi:hypothetical protein
MSAETSMTDEVKTVAKKISSWAQILMTELCSMKSHTKENMWNMKACTNLLYIFVMNWDNLTSATSADTAISTSAVATSPSSQESVNCTNGFILKQLIAAMSVNQHSKWCLLIHSDLKKREWNSDLDYNKLLLNWMWTCQTTMSVQFWYLHSWLEELALSQVTS